MKPEVLILCCLLRAIAQLRVTIDELACHRGGPGFEPGSGHVGFCGGQSRAGAGFLRVLRFPLPVFITPISPQSQLSIIWDWYNRPEVAAVPSGLSLTPLITKKVEICHAY
jgi:hypothetical protein